MMQTRSLLVGVVVVGLVLGMVPVPTAAQEDVTLTVTVATNGVEAVGNAELTATWDGESATEVTSANGKAFIDVPTGATVDITV